MSTALSAARPTSSLHDVTLRHQNQRKRLFCHATVLVDSDAGAYIPRADTCTPLLPEGNPGIDADPIIFNRGEGGRVG